MLDQRAPRFALLAVLAVSLGACRDLSAPASSLEPGVASQSGGGGGGGGGGGTGGNNGGRILVGAAPTTLPTTAPAPDVIYRESFGSGNGMRPTGGNGAQHQAFAGAAITGFWVEYPGSRNNAWISGDVGQSWNFAGSSSNPFEMPSPLDGQSGGAVVSMWSASEQPTTYPTALLPVTLPAAGYELSMEGYPAPIANGYIAIGFTNSAVLNSNLTTSGAIWLRVRDLSQFGVPLTYELRTGSLATGTVLASGQAGAAGWNRMSIRVSPSTGTVTLSVDGNVIGTYNAVVPTPKYAAFEGVGVLDDFVIRR